MQRDQAMNEPIIDPRYREAYRIAHEERAKSFRKAFRWVLQLDRVATKRADPSGSAPLAKCATV